MIRIPAITIPMTCHVFPNVRPNSVIPLVSTSMKPAPRKKNDRWLNRGDSVKKFPLSRPAWQRPSTARYRREAELLPVPYFHVVFSLPAAIADIAYQNKAVIYDLLFKASSEATLTIAADPKHLGA